MLASAANLYSLLDSSSRALQIFLKYSCSSLERTCFTRGFTVTLSLPLMAARLGFALGPLGANSWFLESAVVGF